MDENLEGGAMEFCGREPLDVLGWGDCSNNYYKLTKEGAWVSNLLVVSCASQSETVEAVAIEATSQVGMMMPARAA